jgi:peptide/nickel transport system permease protein
VLAAIPGLPPMVDALPAGCAFAARCDKAEDRCLTGKVPLSGAPPRAVRCHYPEGPVP